MAGELHDIADFCCCCNTPRFAFGRNLGRYAVFVGLEDGRLMQAYYRRVNTHMDEDNIRVPDSNRHAEVFWESQRDVEQDIVEGPVPSPKSTV